MSFRLQTLISAEEHSALKAEAKRQGDSVAALVRCAIPDLLARQTQCPAADKIAAILKYTQYSAPTADIENMLSEIEQGYDLE